MEPQTPEPQRRPREGWAEQCKLMHERGDDKLLDEWPPSEFDLTEWEW